MWERQNPSKKGEGLLWREHVMNHFWRSYWISSSVFPTSRRHFGTMEPGETWYIHRVDESKMKWNMTRKRGRRRRGSLSLNTERRRKDRKWKKNLCTLKETCDNGLYFFIFAEGVALARLLYLLISRMWRNSSYVMTSYFQVWYVLWNVIVDKFFKRMLQ